MVSYSPSKMVELKFLSPKLPEKVAIYKVLFKVSPSIRSPVICQNCLRYGHTAKFCRGKANCLHCGLPDHSFSNCPTKESTVPSCFHCKGSHIATNRSCMEWSRQKNIKKIMATENVSYKDAVFIIKNNIVNKSSTFSDITAKSKANDVKESSNNNIIISDETFPNIGESHWNCRSLRARRNDFSFLLVENKCQCALLSETWLLPNSRISIPNYHVFRQDRLDGYGGVAIVIHQSINSKRISLNDNTRHMLELHSIDVIGIEITINDKTVDLCYISPSSNPSPETYNNIFSLMNRSSLIGGDFYGHHPVWGSSTSDFRGNLIHSAILDYGLCVLNNGEATRINRPPYPDTMVDISISSPNISLSFSWSMLTDPFGSDHLPILINIPNRPSYSNSSHNNNNTSTRFNFYATDWNKFTYQVSSLLESFTLDSSPS
ncbi:hypothetical protein ACI65C_000635 [Semiaphis heraclei]